MTTFDLKTTPVDLVYMWVDGNDPVYRAKLEQYLPAELKKDIKELESRYFDTDELKYSLRSVEKYANWVNHIYIVTDNQIPKWLDIKNSRITIIDHKDIIPKEYLPTFNSSVIENYLFNIKSLSEYFLFANDDMMFHDYTPKEYFFTMTGEVINRFRKWGFSLGESLDGWQSSAVHTTDCFFRKSKVNLQISLNHQICGMKKTSMYEAFSFFKKEILIGFSKFRNNQMVLREIFNFYDIYRNKSIFYIKREPFRIVNNRIEKMKNSKENVRNILLSTKGCSSLLIIYYRLLEQIKLFSFCKNYLICINDNTETTDNDRAIIKKYLEKKYKKKTNFEL